MVKKFPRFSLTSIILQIITIAFIILSIYFCFICTRGVIIDAINGKLEGIAIFASIIYFIGIILFINIELTFLIGNIILSDTSISVKGDIRFHKRKIQFPTSINYKDIANIEIVALRKNSNGKQILLSRPIPYLVLTNKKGNKFRFGLHFMSKKTVNLLLITLLDKCTEVGGIHFDVTKLMSDFLNARLAMK